MLSSRLKRLLGSLEKLCWDNGDGLAGRIVDPPPPAALGPVVDVGETEADTGEAVAARAGGVTLRSLPGRADVAVIEDPPD